MKIFACCSGLGQQRVAVLFISMVLILIAPTALATDPDYADLDLSQFLAIRIDQNIGSVLHSHIHKKGEWMVAYRYMFMAMDGNRDGSDGVNPSEVLDAFPVTPLHMEMQGHMVSVMYSPSDDLTLMAMLPYQQTSMDHLTRMGGTFTTRSSGVGDLMLMTNTVFRRAPADRQLMVFHSGLSIPTGSIDERGATPMGPDQKLPYPMQIGSGTLDVMLGLSVQNYREHTAFGASANTKLRTGENDNDYRLGHLSDLSGWWSYAWNDRFSGTLRIKGQNWGNISGADPELNTAIVPTADPNRRAGTRVDLLFDLELYAKQGSFQGAKANLSLGVPLYQDLDGPQLASDWQAMVGWQWTF